MTIAFDGMMGWRPSLGTGRWERIRMEKGLEAVGKSWLGSDTLPLGWLMTSIESCSPVR